MNRAERRRQQRQQQKVPRPTRSSRSARAPVLSSVEEAAAAGCVVWPACAGKTFWVMEPEPDAPLLVLAGPASIAAARAAFPHGRELDFEGIAAAGFAGVHASPNLDAACNPWRPLWGPGATCWLRWVFLTAPITLLVSP